MTAGAGAPGALQDKVVLVTGGSSGIGRAIALAAGRAGADVALTYFQRQDRADEVLAALRALGRHAEAVRADVSQPLDVDRVQHWVAQEFGRVDGWVNNAGADILTGANARLTPIEKLDLVLDVDLRGTILASWAAVELMARQPSGGVVLNMSWDHVDHGLAGENPTLYAAAKGGIESFSKSLARSVAPAVRVNILAPGFIATAFADEAASAAWRRQVEGWTPLGRWGVPEDIAGAAVFLCSDAAAFMTGQTVKVNGGVVM